MAASANVSQSGTDLGSTFTIGTEVATGGATVSPTGNSISISLGEETAFGEAFQILINLSSGEPNIILWNETDDSQTATWTEVSPGSTD